MTSLKKSLQAFCLILCLQALALSQSPELVVPTSHSHFVWSVAFNPDGKLLASGCKDKTVKLWEAASGRQLATLTHPAEVWSVAFSPDGKTLASGGNDFIVRLWDTATGLHLSDLKGHTGSIYGLAFSPDGRTLASGSWDKTVKLWSATAVQNGGPDAEPVTLDGHTGYIMSVAFSPDGKMLASASGGLEGAEAMIKLWNLDNASELRTLDKSTGSVNAVAFSPDGLTLVSGGTDRTVKLWEVATGHLLKTLSGHKGAIESVTYSHDGKTVFSAGEHIKHWDIDTGEVRRELPKTSHSIALSRDGNSLACTGLAEVTLWHLEAGAPVTRTLMGRTLYVNAASYSPDGSVLATAGTDITFWDINSGMPLHQPDISHPNALSIAFSPVGKTLASAGMDQLIKLWNLDTGREQLTLAGHTNPVNAVTFSPDGRLVASGGGIPGDLNFGVQGQDYTVRVWDAARGRALHVLSGHTQPVYAAAFSPDGRILASGSGDGTVKLWDVKTGREISTLRWYVYAVMALAFSPDGKLLASGNHDRLILWDVATRRMLKRIDAHNNRDSGTDIRSITSVAFSPDGKLLASGSADKTIKLWDVSTGEARGLLATHNSQVKSVAFSPDGTELASASPDTQTKIWDVRARREKLSLIKFNGSDWFAVTPDGLFDGTPEAWNQMLWRFSKNTLDIRPVEVFFSEFFRQGLVSRIMSGEQVRADRNIAQLDRRQPRVVLSLGGEVTQTTDGSLSQRDVSVRVDLSEVPSDVRNGQGSGVRDVRLFRNGTLVKVWRGDIRLEDGSARLEATVPIMAGANRITAYAFNRANIKSVDAALAIQGSAVLKRPARLYVLSIGINKYAYPDYNLKYAKPDAEFMSREVVRRQSSLGYYERAETLVLTDEHATRKNILLALKRLAGGGDDDGEALPTGTPDALHNFRAANPEDTVIIFFAGHGRAQGGRFFLIPYDIAGGAQPPSLLDVLARSISDQELERSFEGIDAGKVLLVIDTCDSGQVLEAGEKRRGPLNVSGVAQLAYEKGIYVLTAAQSYQVALGSQRLQHGYLTYSLVNDGLREFLADRAPQDGRLLVREWLDYAARRVPQIVRGARERRHLVQARVKTRPDVQTPRVYYRRELELAPFIIATASPQSEPRRRRTTQTKNR